MNLYLLPDKEELLTKVRCIIDDMVVQRYGELHQVDVDTETANKILDAVYSTAKKVEIDKLKDDWKDTPLSKSCTIHPHCLSDDCMDCEYFHKFSDFIKQKMEKG